MSIVHGDISPHVSAAKRAAEDDYFTKSRHPSQISPPMCWGIRAWESSLIEIRRDFWYVICTLCIPGSLRENRQLVAGTSLGKKSQLTTKMKPRVFFFFSFVISWCWWGETCADFYTCQWWKLFLDTQKFFLPSGHLILPFFSHTCFPQRKLQVVKIFCRHFDEVTRSFSWLRNEPSILK